MSRSNSTIYLESRPTEGGLEFSSQNTNEAMSNIISISSGEVQITSEFLNQNSINNQHLPDKPTTNHALKSDTNKAMLIVNSIECNFDMPIEYNVKDFLYQCFLAYKQHPALQQGYSIYYDAIKFVIKLNLSENKAFEMLRFLFSNIEIKAKLEGISDFDNHFKDCGKDLNARSYEEEIDIITERLERYVIFQADIEKGFTLKEIIYEIINLIEKSSEMQARRFGKSSHSYLSQCIFNPIFDDDEISSIKTKNISNFVRVLITVLKDSTQCSANFDKKN